MWSDFHLHSDLSDGEFAPARVMDIVADAGVGIAALTDHDTTAGHAEARARADARGIRFVGGIEMTAYAHAQVIHILGLGVDGGHPALDAANAMASQIWMANQRRWIIALAAEGFDVSEERDLAGGPLRLPLLVKRLSDRGVDGGDPRLVHARFREFFAALPPAAYEGLPTPAFATEAIHASGGVSILAHPGRIRGDGSVESLVGDVDGVEAQYAAYSEVERAALLDLAKRRGKLFSCGSDYHGFWNGGYVNPRFEAPEALLEKLARRSR